MFSYVFMKILESRPARYDWGVNLVTLGHSDRIKRRIVDEHVKPGIRMLDVGCGTGTLAIAAAKTGAQVEGIDISSGMLGIAKKRLQAEQLDDQVKLTEAGVLEIDDLFEAQSFDLITSTLVMSELYAQEREWVFQEFRRLLKPDGVIVIAGEVRPANVIKRFLHWLIRLPLAIITYIVSQTGTKAVKNLAGEIQRNHFQIVSEKRSMLGSFTTIVAQPLREQSDQNVVRPIDIKDDISILKSIWDFIGRWFPNPVEPGVRIIGTPDEKSPVIVTCNFHLTVRRMEKALQGVDCFLLVAPTNGINVWCASCGKEMTEHSVASVLKSSRIKERVAHHSLILPQLAAAGVNAQWLHENLGWVSHWGPVYGKDLPAYLQNHRHKSEAMTRTSFPFGFRLEMLLSMSAVVWGVAFLIAWAFSLRAALWLTAFFWGNGLLLFGLYPYLPTDSGWAKALLLSAVEILGIGAVTVLLNHEPFFALGQRMILGTVITLLLGFDLKGMTSGGRGEAETAFAKLKIPSFGHIYEFDSSKSEKINQDKKVCTNCGICLQVCPSGVFEKLANGSVETVHNDACFQCGACVVQCPDHALKLS